MWFFLNNCCILTQHVFLACFNKSKAKKHKLSGTAPPSGRLALKFTHHWDGRWETKQAQNLILQCHGSVLAMQNPHSAPPPPPAQVKHQYIPTNMNAKNQLKTPWRLVLGMSQDFICLGVNFIGQELWFSFVAVAYQVQPSFLKEKCRL